MKTLKVISIVGGVPALRELENNLEAMQAAVGGYLEAVPMPGGLTLWVNEEGRLDRLAHNAHILTARGWLPVVGDCFLTRTRGGDCASVKETDLQAVQLR